MKASIFALTLLVLSAFTAHAGAGAEQSLSSPQWAYTAMNDTFPEFKESLGGFSYEITLNDLVCVSSNTNVAAKSVVKVQCSVRGEGGQTVTKVAPQLFLVLLNAGLPIDRVSEGGSTYISAQQLACTVIDAKTTRPNQGAAPEYSCDIKN